MISKLKIAATNLTDTKKDFLLTVIFGLLSAALGFVQLTTPGFEGSYSDLREIALLNSLFHIKNPVFLFLLCALTLLGIPANLKLAAVYTSHLIPLFFAWLIYRWLEKRMSSSVQLGLVWCGVSLGYYVLMLYPILIVTYKMVGFHVEQNFLDSYRSVYLSGEFEMIATVLISSLYLTQLHIRRSLEHTNKNLEEIVRQRTQELTQVNHELLTMNENLEQLVKERTEKINAHLVQITKYAHMNSHEVRAPLARVLGLMHIIKKEENPDQLKYCLKMLEESSEELDAIVKKMNRLLEEEAVKDAPGKRKQEHA